jgi:uncharacterized protein (TIGR03437 family)
MLQRHAASYSERPLAPGQLALLGRLGKAFELTPGDGTQVSPWPTTVSDYQVLVNGSPAAIFYVNPNRIDFQVPYSAPTSGIAEILVQRASTGEILGALNVPMAPANPGFFTSNAAGTGLAAAVNDDGTVNSPSNPIGRGKIISFYLTGAGRVDNPPADGAPPAGPTPTPRLPTILSPSFAPSGRVPEQFIKYSGLGAFAGGWQINFEVPEQIPPGASNAIALVYDDFPSNIGPSGTVVVTFAVK